MLNLQSRNSSRLDLHPGGGGTHMFSVRGRATEQGILFVKIGSMTWSIFVIFYSEGSF